MKQFDIIIPHLNGPHLNALAEACLRSVRTFSEDYRVIWIQNGGDVPENIEKELSACEEAVIIRNPENEGFVKATNAGICISDAPYVVLLNNDTRVSDNWLSKLRDALKGNIGISGPLSSARGSWQGRMRRSTYPSAYVIPDSKPLAFFCVMIRRDVIEKVGLLDEGFGVGLGDDDDYCKRVRKAGFRAALIQDLVIVHEHRSTFKTLFSITQIHSMQQRALQRLRVKDKLPCLR